MKIENVKTNAVPSITWNWLKTNNDVLSFESDFTPCVAPYQAPKTDAYTITTDAKEFNIEKVLNAPFGSGIFNKSNPKVKDIRKEDGSFVEKASTAEIPDYKDHPLQKYVKENEITQFITINKSVKGAIKLNFDPSASYISSQIIYAKENTEATVIMVYDGNAENSVIQTKVYAEPYAKVHLIKVQLLNENALQLDDTQVYCEENGKVQLTQIELGGKHINSGLHVNLNGYQSGFTSKTAYLCQKEQIYDFNHIVYHYGQKSECNMQVDGTLKDNAVKAYRGTIDLKKGCCGAKGHEMEETLLLSPKAVNKSLPIILCDEEDVEGEHGATIGRLSSDVLFYMQSRGISEKEAEILMSRAKIQAAIDYIPDEDVKTKIVDFLDKIL